MLCVSNDGWRACCAFVASLMLCNGRNIIRKRNIRRNIMKPSKDAVWRYVAMCNVIMLCKNRN